jgi:NAD(P)-dependent dehydrogenase (short-subunit alcohol dehydrogenase family)
MRSVVLVAGASSSLGGVLCRELAKSGHKVYAGYCTHPVHVEADVAIVPIKLDVTSDMSCEQAILTIFKEHGKIDALVNLVAVSPAGAGMDFEVKDFEKIMDTNVVGAFRLIKLVLPHLPPSGKVINVGSLSGLISFPRFSLYSASKFALRAMSLSLYHELLSSGRYVVCISPGALAKDPPTSPPEGSARGRIPFLNWLLPLTSPQRVSRVIIDCLADARPPAEILVGRDTKLLVLVHRLIPGSCWHFIQKYVWKRQQ